MHISLVGILLQCRSWFRRWGLGAGKAGAGGSAGMLHFYQDPRCCWCGWSMDHALSSKSLHSPQSTAPFSFCFSIRFTNKSTSTDVVRWYWGQENQESPNSCLSVPREVAEGNQSTPLVRSLRSGKQTKGPGWSTSLAGWPTVLVYLRQRSFPEHRIFSAKPRMSQANQTCWSP